MIVLNHSLFFINTIKTNKNMGILKDLTEEYFGEKIRKEDEINIEGLNVKIVSFKDNNGNYHRRGYKPKDWYYLIKLLERMVEVRGDEGDFNDIDTSEIEEMNFLFTNKTTFNGDISGWDVSNVKDMEGMFSSATSFNQDISNWDIRGVHKFLTFTNCPIKDEFKPKMK